MIKNGNIVIVPPVLKIAKYLGSCKKCKKRIKSSDTTNTPNLIAVWDKAEYCCLECNKKLMEDRIIEKLRTQLIEAQKVNKKLLNENSKLKQEIAHLNERSNIR